MLHVESLQPTAGRLQWPRKVVRMDAISTTGTFPSAVVCLVPLTRPILTTTAIIPGRGLCVI